MDQIRKNMIKAARELRAFANSTTDSTLKHRLLEQANNLELASQEDSQNETERGPRRTSAELRLQAP